MARWSYWNLAQVHRDNNMLLFCTTFAWTFTSSALCNTVRCRYNTENFHPNSQKSHTIARHWVSFVNISSDAYICSVIVLRYAKSCCVGPRYNGTRLYFVKTHVYRQFSATHITIHLVPLVLTLKHRETHGYIVSTVATDALVLKHQAISIHNAEWTFIVIDQFDIKVSHLWWTTLRNKITVLKKITQSFRG